MLRFYRITWTDRFHSLVAQDVETLMGYASHPISSRLLDTIIQSPAVSPKDRRKVIMAFLERFKDLAQDKSGSWVAQAIWDKADGYMKVSANHVRDVFPLMPP